MSKFPGLDLLLNIDTVNAPILDPYVCDLIYRPLSQHTLHVAYNHIVYRLKNAGFHKQYDIKLISQHSFDFPIPDIEYCADKFCPSETIFLLTFSANGTRFITPPYGRGSYEPMSWDEWIFKIYNGEQLPLLIRAPWAQAKFINVAME